MRYRDNLRSRGTVLRRIGKGFGLAAIFVIMFRMWIGPIPDMPQITVDFDDVVLADAPVAQTQTSLPPPLRVALAAMISPTSTLAHYKDLLSRVGEQIGRRTVFVQKKTYAEVDEVVEGQQVDFALVCSGPYVRGHAKFGMEILAVPVVDGKPSYRSYVIVNADSGLRTLGDLRGRKFAFSDPRSNTGMLAPTYMLAQLGYTPEAFFSEFFYTYGHDNSIRAVANKMADGAGVESLVWEFLNTVEPDLTARTKIIAKSPIYGIPPIVVHPALDAGLKASLREVFLSLHEDKEAIPLLRHLRIDRFELGEDSMYDSVRTMMEAYASAQARPHVPKN